MSRVQAIALALGAAVLAFMVGRLLAGTDEPEPPEPVVVDEPSTTGLDPGPSSPGTGEPDGTAPASTSTTTTTAPAIVPPPTVGPSAPPAGGDDDDDGGDDGDDDGAGDDDG